MEVIMLKTNYILSLSLLISIPVCAMERPPRLEAKPAGKSAAKASAKPAAVVAATPKLILKAAAKPAPAVANIKSTCAVCFDEKTALDTRTLACGHKFCLDCLRSNIQTAVRDKQTQALKCFDPSCKRPIDIADLRKIVYDKDTQNQINDIQLQEWLTQQANIKHCPTPNCHFSFVNERADQFTHKCPDCKAEYCGKCMHTHNPRTSCDQAAQDRNLAHDRNAQERANQAWQEANTKPCPQCGTRIEKNEGCMHMNCTRCHYHYCWNCLGAWSTHNNYYHCPNRSTNPLTPQAQPRQQEENITWDNAHIIFARDPRGFVNSLRTRNDLHLPITMEFAERFMNLSCENQGNWTARITDLIQQDVNNYWGNISTHWETQLQQLEPFRLSIRSYSATNEGTFRASIIYNRGLNLLAGAGTTQIQEWIIHNNPQDLIMFNGWTCETTLSQARLQEVLNQAAAHFRNRIPNNVAQPVVPLLYVNNRHLIWVRGGIYNNPNYNQNYQRYANFIAEHVQQTYGNAFTTIINADHIFIFETATGSSIQNEGLQGLVDMAHYHFANQNQ